MPKGRMLNKKICYDEKVSKLSLEATLLYTWCIPHLDVKGRLFGEPNILKGTIVPYISKLTHQMIAKCLKEMEKQDLIVLYGNERKYLEFKGFGKNQKIYEDRESPSIIPTLEELVSNSVVTPEQVKESKVKESKDTQALPFLETLKNNPTYKHIDFDHELGKMDVWLARNPTRKKTEKFVLNWINKIDKPVEGTNKRRYL